MPKKVKVHPNERIDIPDYVRGSNEYTAEMLAYLAERGLIDRRSRILEGFRVELADQTTNPGQLTVYNGTAMDRDGKILHDEDADNTAKSVTLSGASTTFYLEIEFVEADSDSDSRAFWDPTFDQTDPIPDGQEFDTNVATRESPTWQIVTPVSTTGFEQTTDLSSTKIPLMQLTTDGSNEITVAVNPGLVQVQPASTLEYNYNSGVTDIRVVSAREFAVGDVFTLGVYDGSPDPGLTITSINYDTNVITFAPATSFPHITGSVLRRTSGTGRFIREVTSYDSSSHPDKTGKLFKGDEIRGRALITSKELVSTRDDLAIRNLKDQVDALAALVRELKFGSPDPAAVSTAPPSLFATEPRWYDQAGGVQGARGATISVGNGTTTFGDFNGTTEATLSAAIAALPSTGGIIRLKPGTYTISSQLAINTASQNVHILGEYGTTIIRHADAANPALLIDPGSGTQITFENVFFDISGGTSVIIEAQDCVLSLRNCFVQGGILSSGTTQTVCRFSDTIVQSTVAGTPCFDSTNTGTCSGQFKGCKFITQGASNVGDVCIRGIWAYARWVNCEFQGAPQAYRCIETSTSGSGALDFCNCYFQGERAVSHTTSSVIRYSACFFSTIPTDFDPGIDLDGVTSVLFSNCQFNHSEIVAIPSTAGTPVIAVGIDNACEDVQFVGCSFDAVSSATAFAQGFDTSGATTLAGLTITSCHFKNYYRGIYLDLTALTGTQGEIHISDCTVDFNGVAYSEAYGVRLTGGDTWDATIRGVTVTDGGAVLDGAGISVDSMGEPSHVVIDACQVRNFGALVSATAIEGIFVDGTGLATADACAVVSNCVVRDIQASGLTVGIRSLQLDNVNISGCVVTDIESNAGAAIGIGSTSTPTADRININGCTVEAVDGATDAYMISVSGADQTSITNNILRNLIGASQVEFIQCAAVGELAKIAGNLIYGTDGSGHDKIIDVDYTSQAQIGVFNNVIEAGGNATEVIHVRPNAAGSFLYGATVVGNSISRIQKAGAQIAIQIDGPTAGSAGSGPVVVAGNLIQESTYNADHAGIQILGTSTFEFRSVTVTGNSIYGVNTAATRMGTTGSSIRVSEAEYVCITGNVSYWNNGGSAAGDDILALNCQQGTITGNCVTSHTDGGNEIGHTGGDFAVVGNSVGGNGLTGAVGAVGSLTVTATDGDPLNHLGP